MHDGDTLKRIAICRFGVPCAYMRRIIRTSTGFNFAARGFGSRNVRRIGVMLCTMVKIPPDAIVVGSPESYFVDDVAATCGRCGVVVYNRPSSPRENPHMCTGCYLQLATPGDQFIIPQETIEELRRWRALYGMQPKGRTS